jgi:hypothetical protein
MIGNFTKIGGILLTLAGCVETEAENSSAPRPRDLELAAQIAPNIKAQVPTLVQECVSFVNTASYSPQNLINVGILRRSENGNSFRGNISEPHNFGLVTRPLHVDAKIGSGEAIARKDGCTFMIQAPDYNTVDIALAATRGFEQAGYTVRLKSPGNYVAQAPGDEINMTILRGDRAERSALFTSVSIFR